MQVTTGANEIVGTGEQDADIRGGEETQETMALTVLLLFFHLDEKIVVFYTSAEQSEYDLCSTILCS